MRGSRAWFDMSSGPVHRGSLHASRFVHRRSHLWHQRVSQRSDMALAAQANDGDYANADDAIEALFHKFDRDGSGTGAFMR